MLLYLGIGQNLESHASTTSEDQQIICELRSEAVQMRASAVKSTSNRFKVSVLMKVLPHRIHLSTELPNQQSVIYHNLEETPSCSYKERKQCRKQPQNWLQVRVHHQRESHKLRWHHTIPLLRRLLYVLKVQKLQ